MPSIPTRNPGANEKPEFSVRTFDRISYDSIMVSIEKFKLDNTLEGID